MRKTEGCEIINVLRYKPLQHYHVHCKHSAAWGRMLNLFLSQIAVEPNYTICITVF